MTRSPLRLRSQFRELTLLRRRDLRREDATAVVSPFTVLSDLDRWFGDRMTRDRLLEIAGLASRAQTDADVRRARTIVVDVSRQAALFMGLAS